MKPIQLTKEQQAKFKEMVRKLFPEYDTEEAILTKQFVVYKKTETKYFINDIHWFEFCMTYLIEKLNDYLGDTWEEMPPYVANVYGGAEGKWNIYTKFHFHYPKDRYTNHPIDYLYEEFKKKSE
jgi:hypothetical protein